MRYSLSYFNDAKQDVIQGKAWYKEKQPGLERRFADSIKRTLFKVQENPFLYAVRYKNIRVAYTKHFPYGIHFYIDDELQQIVIIAILHSKRDPSVAQIRS